MKQILRILMLTALLWGGGCTTITKLEVTPTYSRNMVTVKGGLIHHQALGGLVGHGYLAETNEDGTTCYLAEIMKGRVIRAWCLNLDGEQKQTVISGMGVILRYDHGEGVDVYRTEVSNGRILDDLKPLD